VFQRCFGTGIAGKTFMASMMFQLSNLCVRFFPLGHNGDSLLRGCTRSVKGDVDAFLVSGSRLQGMAGYVEGTLGRFARSTTSKRVTK
jgi:hypothetical protein